MAKKAVKKPARKAAKKPAKAAKKKAAARPKAPAITLHPGIDRGFAKSARKGFSGGTLTCNCATDPVVVDMQHDLGRGLAVLVEESLQHVNHELHRRVVVVEQQHPVHARPLGLRPRLGDDGGPRSAGILPLLAVVVGHPRRGTP